MSNQFDTIIGERGVTLSGGQKQRTAIARALIKNAPILIFDDSLSALDTKTETEILDNIYSKQLQKTIIIISQRVSSVKNADHIIFLNNGTIIEQGNHDELLQLKGKYADLYVKQISTENVLN
jgi:ATP-binding cassette subfamily B multidrug efflux pump